MHKASTANVIITILHHTFTSLRIKPFFRAKKKRLRSRLNILDFRLEKMR